MPAVQVTRTYVQMLRPDELRPADAADSSFGVEQADPCPPDLYRFLYGTVGLHYHWVDRRAWSDEEIEAHVSQRGISIWVLRDGVRPAGFFELARHPDGSI